MEGRPQIRIESTYHKYWGRHFVVKRGDLKIIFCRDDRFSTVMHKGWIIGEIYARVNSSALQFHPSYACDPFLGDTLMRHSFLTFPAPHDDVEAVTVWLSSALALYGELFDAVQYV